MEREKEMMRFAYTQSPFYKSLLEKRKLSMEDLMEDWTKVPVVDRRQMACADEDVIPFSSDTFPERNQRFYEMSFGSNGVFMGITWSLKDMISSMSPLWEYRSKFYGIKPQDRSCYFYLYPDFCDEGTARDPQCSRKDLGFSMLGLNRDRVEKIYKVMCEYEPKWILMQPSIAMIFADYICESGAKEIPSLEYVELTGEWVTEKQRRKIENAFHCKTVNIYGSYEMNVIAYECPEGHLHLLEDNVLAEIMDGKKVLSEGVEGDVVVTSLHNSTMPFVRYMLGDRGDIFSQKCSCGHPGRIIKLTKAKKNDLVRMEKDIDIPPYEFTYALQCVMDCMGTEILQYQVEQTGYFSFIVTVVTKDKKLLENTNMQEDFNDIFKDNILHEHLRKSIYTFRFRNELPSEKAARKMRTFWAFKGNEKK